MSGQEVAEAYDRIASTYDRAVEGDEWVRRRLWNHYLRVFKPGQHILDVSCGTGIDAIFLADHRIRVTGIDLSVGMIAEARRKVHARGLTTFIDLRVLDLSDLSTLPPGSFDGAISAFGGLSTVADLRPFARDVARLLRPGSHLIAHLVNRTSLWEWLGRIVTGRLIEARRIPVQEVRTFVIGGRPLPHYLYGPDDAFHRFFATNFTLRGVHGQGVLRPPHTMRRIPPIASSALGRLERLFESRPPFRGWGRFYVLDLERR